MATGLTGVTITNLGLVRADALLLMSQATGDKNISLLLPLIFLLYSPINVVFLSFLLTLGNSEVF